MPDSSNSFGHIACLHLQFLPLYLESCHPIGGTVCLVSKLLQATLELLLKSIESEIDHCWLEKSIGESSKKLLLKRVFTNHDVVLAHTSVPMAGTAVFDVAPAAIAGDDDHPRTAETADDESAKEIFWPMAHATVATDTRSSESLADPLDLGLNPIPEFLRNQPPFGYLDPHPIRFGAWPAGLAFGLRVSLLPSPIPNEHTPVTFVAQHLAQGRWMPSANLPGTGQLRRLYPFSIQSFCYRRKTAAIRIHIEDTPHDRSLFFIEFQLHATHCSAPVFAGARWIFNRNVAIPEAFPSRLHTLQRPSLLPAMNLFT